MSFKSREMWLIKFNIKTVFERKLDDATLQLSPAQQMLILSWSINMTRPYPF